jgi:hypothetical protein
MARITLMDICDGIADAFDGAAVVLNAGVPAVTIDAQSYDEITEGMQNTPVVQVWPTDSLTDATTDTDRTTFKGCVKHGQYQFTVRGFARPRSQVGEDMEATVRMWDALEAILEEEGTDCTGAGGTCTFFGVSGIRSMSWSAASPQVYVYGGAPYVGFEMTIQVDVF